MDWVVLTVKVLGVVAGVLLMAGVIVTRVVAPEPPDPHEVD